MSKSGPNKSSIIWAGSREDFLDNPGGGGGHKEDEGKDETDGEEFRDSTEEEVEEGVDGEGGRVPLYRGKGDEVEEEEEGGRRLDWVSKDTLPK